MGKRFELEHYNADLIDVYDNKLNTKRVMGIDEIFDLLNEQDEKIRMLENIVAGKELAKPIKMGAVEIVKLQNSKAIEVLEDIIKTCNLAKEFCGAKATALDITSANVYNQCIDDIKIIIDNQITELRGGINDYEKSNSTSPIILG